MTKVENQNSTGEIKHNRNLAGERTGFIVSMLIAIIPVFIMDLKVDGVYGVSLAAMFVNLVTVVMMANKNSNFVYGSIARAILWSFMYIGLGGYNLALLNSTVGIAVAIKSAYEGKKPENLRTDNKTKARNMNVEDAKFGTIIFLVFMGLSLSITALAVNVDGEIFADASGSALSIIESAIFGLVGVTYYFTGNRIRQMYYVFMLTNTGYIMLAIGTMMNDPSGAAGIAGVLPASRLLNNFYALSVTFKVDE